MRSVWGIDDCLSHAFGSDFIRPAWMEACKTDEEALAEGERRFGTLEKGWEHFLKSEAYARIDKEDARPGSRAIVVWRPVTRPDIRQSFVAVLEPDHQWIIRTMRGTTVVNEDKIISYWGRDDVK